MSTTDSIIQAESGGDPNAQNPNSSASGPGQFIDSTWLATLKAHRPDIAQGQDDSSLLALKTNPQLAAEMTGAYAADNQSVLSKAGLPVTPGSTYLAHFAGPNGAVKIMQADPGADVGDILGPAVVKANPFLQGMTAQGLQAWAAKKMGTTVPSAGAQTALQEVPQPPLVPQAPPIFAQQPQANNFDERFGSPSLLQQAYTGLTNGAKAQWDQAKWVAGGMNGPQPPMYTGGATYPLQAQDLRAYATRNGIAPGTPPIFAPQQKPIDLSGLRAALAARAPIFAQG